MSWHDRTFIAPTCGTLAPHVTVPMHSAESLTRGGNLANIELEGQVYTLRITRQGKLILTK